MTRVKRGYVARRRRKNLFTLTSGFRGTHSKLFRTANQQGMRALVASYRGRVGRKKTLRRLWIVRINAAVRSDGISYNKLIQYLYQNQILLNRKILAQIAILDRFAFSLIVQRIGKEVKKQPITE
nr:ribosomal protein L20 [Aneura pinguis]WGO58692.1 ribosomal protein L20 [Aneura pinguis]WGO58778.1 ribosomal protein L20 [Aneura pinguis]